MIPGQIRTPGGDIELNAGKPARTLVIANDGDRPVQIGSHLHLADANPALRMDRDAARGHHLDIPAGGSVRILPGQETSVRIVSFGGNRRVPGIQTGKSEAEANAAPEETR